MSQVSNAEVRHPLEHLVHWIYLSGFGVLVALKPQLNTSAVLLLASEETNCHWNLAI